MATWLAKAARAVRVAEIAFECVVVRRDRLAICASEYYTRDRIAQSHTFCFCPLRCCTLEFNHCAALWLAILLSQHTSTRTRAAHKYLRLIKTDRSTRVVARDILRIFLFVLNARTLARTGLWLLKT